MKSALSRSSTILKQCLVTKSGRVFSSMAAEPVYKHQNNMSIDELFKSDIVSGNKTIMFPRERNGLDYSLNWSLSADYISVWNNAFRNPSLKTLRQYTEGSVDDKKNICCEKPFAADNDIFTKVDRFDDFAREIKDYLSEVPDLFVEDASIGSASDSQLRIRMVTNDSATAFAIKSMLEKVPKREPSIDRSLSIFIARGFDSSKPVCVYGKDNDSKTISVIVAGEVSISKILADVAKAADLVYNAPPAPVVAPKPAAPKPGTPAVPATPAPAPPKPIINKSILNCGCITINNENCLVFGMCDQCTAKALETMKLYAAHNIILSPDHISKFWGGVYSQSLDAENSIKINNMCFKTVGTNNAEELPKKIYFIGEENKTLSTEDLKFYLKSSNYNDDMCDYICNTLKNAKVESITSDSFKSLF